MTLAEPMKASPETFARALGRGSLFQPGSPCQWGGTFEGHLNATKQNLPSIKLTEMKENPRSRKTGSDDNV